MNNETIRSHYDSFDRIKAFGIKFSDRFELNSRAMILFAANATVTDELKKHGVLQISGSARFHSGTSAKQLAAELLREHLRAIRDTAEAIAVAEDMPEFQEHFVMPRSGSYTVLLTKAKAFLKDAAPHAARFVEFELAEDFLTELATDIAALEKAAEIKNASLSDQIGSTASLTSQTINGLAIRKQLIPLIRNKFSSEPGILAEWESASHIVRVKRGPGPDEPAKMAA
jgi:hypothetical protein